jgi:hypothetical protein
VKPIAEEELETEHPYAQAQIVDDTENDDTVVPQQYEIASFGADWDVEGVVSRLKRGDITVPKFQRDYVWTQAIASRFIESLLLGLPVPGIFVAKEPDSNKLLVIDGQQRLRTLQFFLEGTFNPKPESKTRRVFRLVNVQPRFDGKTYDTLDEDDRIKLRDSVIHATIVRQETPENESTSVYHIFERLNQGAQRLAAHEMRAALYHGDMIDLVKDLNDFELWRRIFGPKNTRLKDQELILRFLALYFELARYERPMAEFLNRFAKRHRNANREFLSTASATFTKTITLVETTIGSNAFRPERAINAAVFDSVMVGLAIRLKKSNVEHLETVRTTYEQLLARDDYKILWSRATADENNVRSRIARAVEAFSTVR